MELLEQKRTKFIFIIFILFLSISQTYSLDLDFYAPSKTVQPYPLIKKQKVKNIILLIGDGMGLAQVVSARLTAVGASGRLYMERMPITGYMNTHSAYHLVTDSAAAGTALATGYKTQNKKIAMSPDRERLTTILEVLKKKGWATGLVATSGITHATPASFASHVRSRYMEDKIASQLLGNKVNVLLGGGKEFFLPSDEPGSKRKDDRDLIEEAKKQGYKYIGTKNELKRVKGKYVLGLFQMGALNTTPPEPSIAEMTKKAITLLNKNKKGFFLMVEGSQIDWACHENNADKSIRQTLLFDLAVKTAVDFASKDKETLVIVLADHETGGLTIVDGNLSGKHLDLKWSTGGHSAVPIIIYSFGVQAEKFTGVHDNTEIPKIFAELLGISPFPVPVK